MFSLTIHRIADNNRSILLGENCGKVSKLADKGQSSLDGDNYLDYTSFTFLHLDFRLGAFHR